MLCNVGQATGLSKEAIHLLLGEAPHNDTLPKYIAEKGESHSYLIFSSIQSSEKFYNINNGKWKPDVKGPPVYMSYVENGKFFKHYKTNFCIIHSGIIKK